MAVSQNALQSC